MSHTSGTSTSDDYDDVDFLCVQTLHIWSLCNICISACVANSGCIGKFRKSYFIQGASQQVSIEIKKRSDLKVTKALQLEIHCRRSILVPKGHDD